MKTDILIETKDDIATQTDLDITTAGVRAFFSFREALCHETMEAPKRWPASWRHYVKITKSAHANSEILKAESWSSQLCKDSIADENNFNEMSNNQRVK